MSWEDWWIWAAAGLSLAIIEVLVPGYLFLGFAIGAAVMAIGLMLGLASVVGSLPVALVVFALLSLVAWLVLRRTFRLDQGQVKTFDRDINE